MSELSYEEYLASKSKVFTPVGIDNPTGLSGMLWDYQRDIVERNLYAGRFLNQLDCGLGKTPVQLEWVHQIAIETQKPVLTIAPLQVCYQTERESHKFNRPVKYYKNQPKNIGFGENIITNYENFHKFNPSLFGGLNLDESSILKGQSSKTRIALSEFVENIPFRLCNSATASPNDDDELLRHAEHLGVGTEKELKGEYFIQDGNNTTKYRLKHYSIDDYWRFVSSWCVAMRKPSDLGYSNTNFIRGKLISHNAIVSVTKPADGMLIPLPARTLTERRRARASTIDERTDLAAMLVNNADAMARYVPDYDVNEPVVVWCDLNQESEMLTKKINNAVEVTGSQTAEDKAQRMIDFSDGKITKLVTKPKIAGHGMNWQHARVMLFVGLSDSFEQVYQAIRRLWRNMQTRDVHVIYVVSQLEGNVMSNIERKFAQHNNMYDNLISNISQYWSRVEQSENEYKPTKKIIIPSWLRS